MTNKKFEDLLKFQEEIDGSMESSEFKEKPLKFQDVFLSMNQKMLRNILNRGDVELIVKKLVQEAYDEFIEAGNRMFKEKEAVSLKDVEAEVPGNLWIKILLKQGQEFKDNISEKDIDMENLKIELKEAKKNNQIN